MKIIELLTEGVAGPKSCWPGHRKVGTQPGTGKNKGKPVNDCEKIKKEDMEDLHQEFDLIESIIEKLAEHNDVDAEVIWEDLETLTEDELYAFAVTSEPIMESQGVAEGSLNESAVFLNPNTVVVGQEHGQPLELSPDTLKKVQAIAAKHGAYYEGNGTDRSYTKGQIDRYAGSWDDEVAKTASPNDPKWLYVLFANVDENNRVERVGVDPKDTIFNRLMDSAQDNSFQGIGFTALALKKFLSMASEGKYDFVKMSQQPATQENLTRFLKAGEALMWPSNWEQYPNRAGKIAKAATVDVRDQYLATRKAGVYVTGSGHLKAVQNITGQQGVAEDWQKANKRDKTDGMSQKAVNAYRRENPGSKLKTAVTTKPGKLKKGGKASKRRSSYCSRSRGQMKMHSISCSKTPDKAICKARRRWNC